MISFKNFFDQKEAYQVGVDKDYQFDINELFQAAKFFTIKYPEKMKDFLIKSSENDEDLKNNIHFSVILKNNDNYKKIPVKPLGDFVGYDVLKPAESPIGDVN